MTASRTVDLHTHFMPAGLPNFAAETGDARWPHLEIGNGDAGSIVLGSELFRRVTRPCWDPVARFDDMDRHGVDCQVMSPVPVTLVYWAEPKLALEHARRLNDGLGEAVEASSGRLLGLGTVPLQDVDLAIGEMERAIREVGLAGLEIGTVVRSAELDHPDLRPFFRAAAGLDVPIFVHPIDGDGATRCHTPMGRFGVGLTTDTALAAMALVFGGVLEDVPDLKVCLSHGGGTFPSVYPRLRLWAAGATDDPAATVGRLDALAGRLTVDSLVFDPGQVPLLVERFGADHIVFGSDYPFIPYPHAAASLAPPVDAAAIRTANGWGFLRATTESGCGSG